MSSFDQIIEDGRNTFAGHVATASGPFEHGKPWHVLWKNPETSNCFMDLIIFRGNLYISGDLGSAVYCWYGKTNPDFLLGCNFGYFHEKCEASGNGRNGMEWDEEAAKKWLKDQREDFIDDNEGDAHLEAVAKELFDDLLGVSHSKFEWQLFLSGCHQSSDDPVTEVFGDDAYSDTRIWTAGEVPMARSILHWQGMKMAFRALGYGKVEKAA